MKFSFRDLIHTHFIKSKEKKSFIRLKLYERKDVTDRLLTFPANQPVLRFIPRNLLIVKLCIKSLLILIMVLVCGNNPLLVHIRDLRVRQFVSLRIDRCISMFVSWNSKTNQSLLTSFFAASTIHRTSNRKGSVNFRSAASMIEFRSRHQ